MPTSTSLRPLEPADERLLAEATLANLNWSGPRFTEADVVARPEFRRYARLVPERGDFGFVAERAGEVIGVGWAQLFPATDAGYGFVDASTPEISLWVREGFRGVGVGRSLLRRLAGEASHRGVARLSLSVEAGNHARRLYAAEGYTAVEGREADGVMVYRA